MNLYTLNNTLEKNMMVFSIHDENGKLAYLDRPYEIEPWEKALRCKRNY